MCYSLDSYTVVGIEELSVTRLGLGLKASALHTRFGCWHNGFNRPVLKHGPRSLTYMQVFGWKTHARNESES